MTTVKILRVKKTPIFDVFVGAGWYNHVRVYYKGGKVNTVGKGVSLSSAQQTELLSSLKKHYV